MSSTATKTTASVSLTSLQREAVSGLVNFCEQGSPHQIRSLTGLAGTGKTTVAAELIRSIVDRGIRPIVIAPTGKAANVLTRKLYKAGVYVEATTMHSAMITEVGDALRNIDKERKIISEKIESRREAGEDFTVHKRELAELNRKRRNMAASMPRLSFAPREPDDLDGDVIICDEASMIGRKDYDKLLSHHSLPKIFIGDYGQLPPVGDRQAINLAMADYKLEEIHRQSSNSGILPLSHYIYHKHRPPGQQRFLEWGDISLVSGMHPAEVINYHETHQIICWTNKLRWRLNKFLRQKKYIEPAVDKEMYPFFPGIGEELMLRTNAMKKKLFNGMMVRVEKVVHQQIKKNPYVCSLIVSFPDELDRPHMAIDFCLLDLAASYPDAKYRNDKRHDHWQIEAEHLLSDGQLFDVQYTYAITCHKSQGSEYKNVFVYSEMPKGKHEWAQWNYTAITRAQESLVIAGMY